MKFFFFTLMSLMLAVANAQSLTCWDNLNVTCSFFWGGNNDCVTENIGNHYMDPNAGNCVNVTLSSGPGIQIAVSGGRTYFDLVSYGGDCRTQTLDFSCNGYSLDTCYNVVTPSAFGYTNMFRFACVGAPLPSATSTGSGDGSSSTGGDGNGSATTNEANSSPAAAVCSVY